MEARARSANPECIVLRTRGTGPEPALATAAALFDGLRSAAGSAGAAPEALAEVARLVPALAAQFRHLPEPVGDESALREGLLQVIAAVVEEQPLLMIVDELQTADIPSRRVMSSVSIRLPRGAMFVVAKEEGPAVFPGAPDDMLAARTMLRLHLGELTVGEVDAVVESMLSMAPGERAALSQRLHAEVGGLPHPLVYMVAALVDEQLLRVSADGLWHVSPALAGRALPIPSAVRERTRVRLERLTPTARATAEALAVFGEESDAPLIATVIDRPRDDVDVALGEADRQPPRARTCRQRPGASPSRRRCSRARSRPSCRTPGGRRSTRGSPRRSRSGSLAQRRNGACSRITWRGRRPGATGAARDDTRPLVPAARGRCGGDRRDRGVGRLGLAAWRGASTNGR